ncbi:MAG: hypothetical protein VW008_00020 [Aquiluna sp.]
MIQAHRLKSCVGASTARVLDDAAVRCNRAVQIGSTVLAYDVLKSLNSDEEPLRFWESGVVDKACALATRGYKPLSTTKALVDRLTTSRDACLPVVELVERKGIGKLLADQCPTYAANALTSLKVHTAKRVARLVHLRARLSQEEFDELSADERKAHAEEVKLACGDALAPPYDHTRHSELEELVNGVRETLGINGWAWYKPVPPKAKPGTQPGRRELLDAIEANPVPVVKAMHRINLELASAGAATFAIVPVRTSFVPRFVHVAQDALSDMGLLDTGDVKQDTLRKRMRKAAEVPTDGSIALDMEIKNIHNMIQRTDRELKKNMSDVERVTLTVERASLVAERAQMKKEREFALCPAKLEFKRLRETHAVEDQRLKQQRIDEQLAVRAKTRTKPSKEEVEASKLANEQRKRAREEEVRTLQARVDAEDTGGNAALQAKSDAFAQVLSLPPKLQRAFASLTSKKMAFADGFSTDGFSIRLNINTRLSDHSNVHEPTNSASHQPKKAKVSTPTPTRVPKRGLIGVEELAKLIAEKSKGRIEPSALKDGMMRDRSPREQNEHMNKLLDMAFGGNCPFRVVGCDPGKRELAVLVDPDIFGMLPSIRPANRPLTLRYTSDERRHDYTPGCYGLRKKQRADPTKASRVKRASMAGEYRSKIAIPKYVFDAERSIVADAHRTKTAVPSAKSPHLDRFLAWAAARERIAPVVRPFYEHMHRRKLRWKRHIEHERSIANFIQRIKAFEKATGKQLVIAWGGWGKSAGRPGQACNKGSAPAMGVGLLNAVAEHFLVVVAPEGYSTKTCYHCGGKASRCVEVEEARRAKRDEYADACLAKALSVAGDDVDRQTVAQTRHDRIVSHRPHVRGIRCCESCDLRLSRDKNGGANIGLNGKRFLLGVGTFKTLSKRQEALQRASVQTGD